MKTRTIATALTVILLSLLTSIKAQAQIIALGKCGDNIFWTLDYSGNLKIEGQGMMYDAYLDELWQGYGNDIKAVFISNGIENISRSAFSYCSNLSSIDIPKSVTDIGDFAFSTCPNLKTVVIPSSVMSIGNFTFAGCSSLTTVVIPNSVTSIGQKVFSGCTSLTSIDIPNSVTSIGKQAFHKCSSLTSINIPNSVKSIGDEAFSYCIGLTSIYVNRGNTTYDSRNNCNAIIETKSNTLVSGCKTTIIPNSVKSIGDKAFCECIGLTSIDIPNSVTSIGKLAFSGCKSLTSINIPNSVTSIGHNAFNYCSSLTSINIPNSVTSIGVAALSDCKSLMRIYVDKGNATYDSRNDCNAIIETKSNTLVSGCKTTIIPNSVKSIGELAFSYSIGLTSIDIPNSVTSIGKWAFSGCKSLTSINIPNSVTSIDNFAFSGCKSLTSINIPNSVTFIGDGAFTRCSGLTDVVIPNSASITFYSTFSDCIGLTKIKCLAEKPPFCNASTFSGVNTSTCELIVPKWSVEAYKKANIWQKFSKIIPLEDGVEAINIADVSVTASAGTITIAGEAAKEATVEVYSVGGSLVHSGKSHHIAVHNAGIYVVRINGKPYKVVVE